LYNTTAAQLLHDADGQCLCWAELFKECLLVNNVANLKKTKVEPYDYYIAFGVKNIAFDDENPTYPESDPWFYAFNDLDMSATGIAGQNMATPNEKVFGVHWIVRRTDGSTYYDPSYGTTNTGAANFTANAVAAWEALVTGAAHWRKVTSSPSVDVTFTDYDW
jgi:hypothetical protein